jgi:hypothetical protein
MMFKNSAPRNSMSKPAQFSFTADLFMLQAILRSEDASASPKKPEYTFPSNCYRQVIEWLLAGSSELGLKPFEDVTIDSSPGEVRVTFPSSSEEDRMHRFFEMFNQKRRLAQGVDPNFPPMPDIYQGGKKPVHHVIHRYLACIEHAFDGESNVIPVPIGPNGNDFEFRCF